MQFSQPPHHPVCLRTLWLRFGKIHGSYDSLVLGMRLALKNNHSLTAGVEYSVQSDISDNDYYQTNIGFRLGYEF